tara:strand:- start:41815 stop:43014 length:1200 start_codon:yes stop_codon:yes gene_type:complete
MMNDQPPLVVHIIYALGTGGLENGLVNIINRSPAERYRHAIICLTQAHDFVSRITAPDVQVIELHKKPGHDVGLYWRLWKTLRTLQPAIVHTRNLAALETQVLGLVMPGVKRVHGEHGRDVNDLDGTNPRYRLLRKALRPLIHAYVAVSRDLAQWLETSVSVDSSRIHQIYNGVDQSQFTRLTDSDSRGVLPVRLSNSDEQVVIGTVGRLAEVKNQALILQALVELRSQYPSVAQKVLLVIVGDGPLAASLADTIEKEGLQSSVWMAGDRCDIAVLLRSMDVFILPSLAEGISNTILEAMSCSLPVIATKVGGSPELVEDGTTGLLVPGNDAQAMCQAIVELAQSPEKRAAMGTAGRQKVENSFNWSRTVAGYLGIYDRLLGRVESTSASLTAQPDKTR